MSIQTLESFGNTTNDAERLMNMYRGQLVENYPHQEVFFGKIHVFEGDCETGTKIIQEYELRLFQKD